MATPNATRKKKKKKHTADGKKTSDKPPGDLCQQKNLIKTVGQKSIQIHTVDG